MRYTARGGYVFDLINDLIGEVTRQGMGGAVDMFSRNLAAQAEGDDRRAKEREEQKKRNIRLRKEAKYARIKVMEAEKAATEAKLREEEEAKNKQGGMFGGMGGGMFGSKSAGGGGGGGAAKALGSMFGWGKKS